MNMALGGGKKYSWMAGGKGGGGGGGGGGGLGSSFGKKTPAGTPSKKAAEPAVASAPAAAAAPALGGATVRGGKVLGAFREDREDGKGIQMRDLLTVLKDGHEKKTLSRSYGRQK